MYTISKAIFVLKCLYFVITWNISTNAAYGIKPHDVFFELAAIPSANPAAILAIVHFIENKSMVREYEKTARKRQTKKWSMPSDRMNLCSVKIDVSIIIRIDERKEENIENDEKRRLM